MFEQAPQHSRYTPVGLGWTEESPQDVFEAFRIQAANHPSPMNHSD
jgi:hypothetical protein